MAAQISGRNPYARTSHKVVQQRQVAIASLPRHLVGAPKFLDMASIGLPSLPTLLGASVAVASAAVLFGEDRVLLLALLVALFFSGIHTYDLTLALCLIPFVPRTAIGIAAAAAGFALILRPANLAKVLPVPWIDSDIFPGSVYATLAIDLFWLVAASSLRIIIVNSRRKIPASSKP